jgi:hypothetical protein
LVETKGLSFGSIGAAIVSLFHVRVGRIAPYSGDPSFCVVPLVSQEVAQALVNRGTIEATTQDGVITLRVRPYTTTPHPLENKL